MKWEEFIKTPLDQELFSHKILTNIECPKCGKKLWKRTDIVLTSYPPQYQYECDCGWQGSAYN